MSDCKRAVLFKSLDRETLPRARRFSREGFAVVCLRAEAGIADAAGFPLRILEEEDWPRFFGQVLPSESFVRAVEAVRRALAGCSPVGPWARSLYGSEDIGFYFGRVLMTDLERLLSAAFVVARPAMEGFQQVRLDRDLDAGEFLPVFADLWKEDGVRGALETLLPPVVAKAVGRLRSGEERPSWRSAARAVYCMAGAAALTLRHLRFLTPSPHRAKVLLRAYPTDWGFLPGRLRTVDFLADDPSVDKRDVCLWMESRGMADHWKAARERGYAAMSLEDVRVGVVRWATGILPVLLRSVPLALSLLRSFRWWSWHAGSLLYHRIAWEEAARWLQVGALVAYNDLSAKSVARNILLRRHGCRTVMYQHSSNQLVSPEGDWAVNGVYPYLVFDTVVTWGKAHSDLFRRHPVAVREYREVGCLWSEHARRVEEEPVLRADYTRRVETFCPKPLGSYAYRLGVFDAGKWISMSAEDYEAFYAGLAVLAGRMPDALFLCKPKCGDLSSLDRVSGRKVRDQLLATGNVVVLPADFETAAVLGLTDLAISTCFTSPTLEMIGAGKPGLYYDAADRIPRAFWRQLPGLVCVTEQQLFARVRGLLESTPSARREGFREPLKDLDGHFDGRGITRLREFLGFSPRPIQEMKTT